MAYTKTNWQDLPDTSTPINASNLNKMEQGIYDAHEKNIITAGLSSDFTISTAGNNELTINNTITQIGGKLSLSNGKILIGSGVNHILISGEVFMVVKTAGAKNFIITHNNNECLLSMNSYASVPSNINHSRGLGTKLVAVSQGDTIGLRVYGSTGEVISSAVTRTYVTVEVID